MNWGVKDTQKTIVLILIFIYTGFNIFKWIKLVWELIREVWMIVCIIYIGGIQIVKEREREIDRERESEREKREKEELFS